MEKAPFIHFIQNSLPAPLDILVNIASQFEERYLEKNEFFVREGRMSNDYLYLEEGCMRAYTHDTNGEEVTTYFYSKNRVVFEASSFFNRTISRENIQAITDCRGYSISFDKLNALFHGIPEFREFGRAMLVKEFSLYKQRTLSLINETAEERYKNLVSTNGELFQHAQLKHIASYLGITDSSLSRIRREFVKK